MPTSKIYQQNQKVIDIIDSLLADFLNEFSNQLEPEQGQTLRRFKLWVSSQKPGYVAVKGIQPDEGIVKDAVSTLALIFKKEAKLQSQYQDLYSTIFIFNSIMSLEDIKARHVSEIWSRLSSYKDLSKLDAQAQQQYSFTLMSNRYAQIAESEIGFFSEGNKVYCKVGESEFLLAGDAGQTIPHLIREAEACDVLLRAQKRELEKLVAEQKRKEEEQKTEPEEAEQEQPPSTAQEVGQKLQQAQEIEAERTLQRIRQEHLMPMQKELQGDQKKIKAELITLIKEQLGNSAILNQLIRLLKQQKIISTTTTTAAAGELLANLQQQPAEVLATIASYIHEQRDSALFVPHKELCAAAAIFTVVERVLQHTETSAQKTARIPQNSVAELQQLGKDAKDLSEHFKREVFQVCMLSIRIAVLNFFSLDTTKLTAERDQLQKQLEVKEVMKTSIQAIKEIEKQERKKPTLSKEENEKTATSSEIKVRM